MIYPLESNITWQRGKDEMTTYAFGPQRIAHSFCPTCGTSIGGKSLDPNFFANNRAINVSSISYPARDPDQTSYPATEDSGPEKHLPAGSHRQQARRRANVISTQVRTLRGIDVDSLKLRKVDGRNDKS